MEQFTGLVKQHDRNGLGVFSVLLYQGDADGSQGGYGHEEILVEYLTVHDALEGFFQDVMTYDEIGDHVQNEPDRLRYDPPGGGLARHGIRRRSECLVGYVEHYHEYHCYYDAP